MLQELQDVVLYDEEGVSVCVWVKGQSIESSGISGGQNKKLCYLSKYVDLREMLAIVLGTHVSSRLFQ